MFDLIIRNAQVFDGLGNPGVRADVAVKQGVVAEIGTVTGQAKQEIDAKGLSLMPGIVDLHTHFDAQVTWDRTMSQMVCGETFLSTNPIRSCDRRCSGVFSPRAWAFEVSLCAGANPLMAGLLHSCSNWHSAQSLAVGLFGGPGKNFPLGLFWARVRSLAEKII